MSSLDKHRIAYRSYVRGLEALAGDVVIPTVTAPGGYRDRATVTAVQQALKAKGYNLGKTGPNKDGVDGVMGPNTATALRASGASSAGVIDYGALAALGVSAPGAAAAGQAMQDVSAVSDATAAAHAAYNPPDVNQFMMLKPLIGPLALEQFVSDPGSGPEGAKAVADAAKAAADDAAKAAAAQAAVDAAKLKVATATTPQAAQAASQELAVAEKKREEVQQPGFFSQNMPGLDLPLWQVLLGAIGVSVVGAGVVWAVRR